MRRDGAGRSLRSQLLLVLVALSVPLLSVGVGAVLLRSAVTVDHEHSAERVRVAAGISDLQARVVVLMATLTRRELLEGDGSALMAMVASSGDVERGFTRLRAEVPASERAEVEVAYDDWRGLTGTLTALPPRLPTMLVSPDALSTALSDIGPRILQVTQVLNGVAGSNAQALQADLDRAHTRQSQLLLLLVGLAVLGLLGAVGASRWLHRRITDPLVALREAAQRFGHDDLGGRVAEDRAPELRDLARAFNTMADRVQDGRRQLQQREQRFRSLVQHASDVVAVVDPEGRVTYVTPSVQRVLGLDVEAVMGCGLHELVHPDDRPLVAAVVAAAATTAGPGQTVSCRLRSQAPGSGVWCSAELDVNDLTADPAVGGLVITARDVTEQTRLHEQLRHSALHDEMTGLANRVLFADRLAHALAGRDGSAPAVLYCDLDGFKQVNDRLGHRAGDALLCAVAARIAGVLRPRDTAARLGGDEFAVLLDGVTAEQAREAAERLVAAVHETLVVEGVELQPRMSVGVAAGAAPGGAEELLRQADTAMYQAKHRGAGEVVVFDADLAGDLLARLELTADLQRAVSGDELVLHYQPTVDLGSGLVTGVEALVRWQHPTRGLVPPGEFIGLAEETGLIVPLGLHVLRGACRQMAAWHAAGTGTALRLAVNLSGKQLERPEIVKDVADCLAETGLDPTLLTLELTESILLDRSSGLLDRLHRLKALGVRLAIDDFGTGYSSLSYLQRLPIDILKIDKSFVDALAGLDRASTGDALAATIVSLARQLGLHSVAEGIEHVAQADVLRELGCDVGQGFLFARPLPADELQALLERGLPPAPALPAVLAGRAGQV